MANKEQPTDYNHKKCYFTFGYYDTNYECPVIDTYIYLGNSSEMKDIIPTMEGFLYFQDAESFANHGILYSKGNKLEEGEMRIWQVREAEAKERILNIDGLIKKLKKCKKLGL